MGKTKTKIMDDSLPQEEVKKPARKLGRQDELVEKLKAELGIEEITEKRAKPETDKATSAVERTTESMTEKESGAKQTRSEPTGSEGRESSGLPGRASGALQSGERASQKKPGKAKPRSKKYQEAVKDLDKTKTYPISQAVDMVKKLSYARFNATLEAHINTTALGLRGLVSLPYASGKKLKILTFGPSGALGVNDGVVMGDDSTIEEINKGKVDFDLLVATPDWMPKLAKVARILGPKGLMPNPKNGTITDDLKKAIAGFQAGKTEYKTESKAKVIHLGLGKLNQPTEQLSANIQTLLQTLGKSRVLKVTLSPTMGPSVKLDLSSL